MGTRGPVRKRAEDLRGNVTRSRLLSSVTGTVTRTQSATLKAPQPRAVPEWSDSAKRIWKAMSKSGQSALYEPSDWGFARMVMGVLTDYQGCERRNGMMLAQLGRQFGELLLTEGSRRRRSIELEERDTPVTPSPARPDPEWHPDAHNLWNLTRKSEQIRWYEPSDWAILRFVCDELTYAHHEDDGLSGKVYASLSQLLADLLLTEGTRRVLDLELGTATAASGPTAGDEEVERWRALLE